jgi:hypothetical protein
MPPLWFKWSHSTPLLTSQSSEIEGQEGVAKTSYIWHYTFGLASGSMASGSTESGSTTSTVTTTICSYQSEWQTQNKQIKALYEEA